MLDVVLKWSADGQQQVIQSAKAITSEVNKGFGAAQQQRQAQWSRQQQQLAREARREAFAKLSVEDKLARLTERRIHLERMLTRAQAQGNQYRVAALRTSLAQVNAAARTVSAPGFGSRFGAGLASGLAPATGVFGAAAIGGGLGGFLGAGLAAAATMVVSALRRAATSAISMADNLDNVAEQIGVSRTDVLRMQEAAAMAGVPQRAAMRGLAQLEQVRAAALAGDEASMALLANYGVTPEMVRGEGTSLALAQAIRGSLGAGGMQANDAANLRRLFGEMPGRQLALLSAIGQTEGTFGLDQDLEKLDRIDAAMTRIGHKTQRWYIRAVAAIPDLLQSFRGTGPLGNMMADLGATATLPPLPGLTASGPRTAGDYQVTAADQARSRLGGLGTLGGARTAEDALARIGLFIGVNNPALRRMDQQIAELRRITRELQGMHRTIQEEA